MSSGECGSERVCQVEGVAVSGCVKWRGGEWVWQ